MPMIISTDIDPVNVQAFGNWFSFKPGQIKNMQKEMVDFLSFDKKYLGFVALPEVCEEDPTSAEAKQAVERAIEDGRRNIVERLNKQRYNLEVSMKRDLDMSNIKADPLSFATPADKEMYKKLARFQDINSDKAAAELDEIKKLKEKLDGSDKRSNTSKTS